MAIYSCLRKCCPGCQSSADVENQSPNHQAEITNRRSEGAAEPLLHQSLDQIEMSAMSAGASESVANVSAQSSNRAVLNASSEEADGSAGGDQSSNPAVLNASSEEADGSAGGDQSHQSSNPAVLNATSEEADGSAGGDQSSNPAVLNASSEEANGYTGGDQSSLSHQAEIPETSEGAAEPLIDQTEMSTMSAGAPEWEANISGRSPNQAEILETSEEANGSVGGDQSSRSHQADRSGLSEGCGDRQAVEAENRDMATSDQKPYDIYLVSTSKQTHHVQKIKNMCRKNGWNFTTPFDGKLGVPVLQSAAEAVRTCSHVVLVITKDDCSTKFGEFNMTIGMALEFQKKKEIECKLIPVRCCDEDVIPIELSWLRGSHIDDDDLEDRMIKTMGKEIRRVGEAQCHSVSGAPGVRDGAGDRVGEDTRGRADDRGVVDRRDGTDVASGSDNSSATLSGKTVLTDIFFINLAQKIGSEWRELATRLRIDVAEIERIIEDNRYTKYRILCILQRWRQRTLMKNDREKVEELCNALTNCRRHDLSEQVKFDAGFGS